MDPRIVREPIPIGEVVTVAGDGPGGMVKIVVDVGRGVLALGGELHADGEQVLLDDGSRQEDLWGANVYPGNTGADQLEYMSLINIRPRQGNRGAMIADTGVRDRVRDMVRRLCSLSDGT